MKNTQKYKNDYFRGFKRVDHAGDHARVEVFVGKQTFDAAAQEKNEKHRKPKIDYFRGFKGLTTLVKNAHMQVLVGKPTLPKASQK